MHVGMMLRQLLNQMMFTAKPWQRTAIAVVAVACGLTMISAGIALGRYDMSVGGVLIVAVAARGSVVALRTRQGGKDASRQPPIGSPGSGR